MSKKIIGLSRLVANLFGYIEESQTEALRFFAPDNPPPKFKKLYSSASGRVEGVFPALMLVTKTKACDYSQDVLRVAVRLLFEAHIQGGKPDMLTVEADIYAAALEKMLTDITPARLTAGVLNTVDSINAQVETEFDVLRGNKSIKPTAFMQGFQTEITYFILGESF